MEEGHLCRSKEVTIYAGVRFPSGTPALWLFLLLQVTPLPCSTSTPNKLIGSPG